MMRHRLQRWDYLRLLAIVLYLLLLSACVSSVLTDTPPESAPDNDSERSIQVQDVWSLPAVMMEDVTESQPCDAVDDEATLSDEDATPCADDPSAGMQSMDMGSRGVVYLTVINRSDRPDRLVAVKTDVAAAAELHRTTIDPEGIMRMRPVEGGIELPAGEQITLEPAGYHIMLVGLKESLSVGDMFRVTLEFEVNGSQTVESVVRLP